MYFWVSLSQGLWTFGLVSDVVSHDYFMMLLLRLMTVFILLFSNLVLVVVLSSMIA